MEQDLDFPCIMKCVPKFDSESPKSQIKVRPLASYVVFCVCKKITCAEKRQEF